MNYNYLVFILFSGLVYVVLIFLSSIESHSLRRMETPGPRPGCGLNLELSDHSVEWWYLVLDQDTDPAVHWGDSTLCWVTIMLNGRHLVRDHDVDRCSTGRLNLVLSSHSFEWRHLVSYQDSAQGWGPFSRRMEALGLLPSIWSPWLRHLVYYQEGTIIPRLGLGMRDTLTLY